MKRFPRSRLSLVSLCVALGVASSACVKPDAPSVGMSKVEASLVFGVKDVPQPIPTPIEQVEAQFVAAPVEPAVVAPQRPAALAPEPEPTFEFAKPSVPKFAPQTPTVRREECPEAPITAAAELAPQPRVTAEPRPGSSRWRLQVSTTLKNADGTTEKRDSTEISGARVIRNFVRKSADVTEFQEVVRQGEEIRVTTYEVNNRPITVNPSDGVGNISGIAPAVGEPERGITLVREDLQNVQTGQNVKSFVPTTGLLMLPLPVVAGDTFSSTAVDPRTGETRTHSAKVLERQRIDACGDLVDGWGVDYERRQSTGGATTVPEAAAPNSIVSFRAAWATQYGGVPIQDNLSLKAGQCLVCPVEFKQRLGQLNPDPLTP